MHERFPQSAATPSNSSEDEQQLNNAKIDSALRALGDEAFAAYTNVFAPAGAGSREEFLASITRFNALPAADRGEGVYDKDRTLEERSQSKISTIRMTPSGHSLTATREVDGSISLSAAEAE